MYFDRFDIISAHYILASRRFDPALAQRMMRIEERFHFRPGLSVSRAATGGKLPKNSSGEFDNIRAILAGLYRKMRAERVVEPAYDMDGGRYPSA